MRINIKLLEDAVPEMVEVEFVYENLITSIVVSVEEADNMQKALARVVKTSVEAALPTPDPAPMYIKWGIPDSIFPVVLSHIKAGQQINAIKEVHTYTTLGLK